MTDRITDEDLDEIEEAVRSDVGTLGTTTRLLITARKWLPRLSAEIRKLQEEVKYARAKALLGEEA